MTKVPSIEKMLKSGMHFGHRTSKWHPKMEPFIFTKRNGVHIVDLIQTRSRMKEALDFMQKMKAEGKTIFFVGTKTQVKKSIKRVATEVAMPYVCEKWMGGTLTNFAIIKKLIKKYKDLLSDKKSGALSKYTKKEQLNMDKQLAKLESKVGGMTEMTKLPDALFVWDIKVERTAVLEAKKKNIPVIAICDTNVNPTGINYPIPSNDDATKTIKLVMNTISEALLEKK